MHFVFCNDFSFQVLLKRIGQYSCLDFVYPLCILRVRQLVCKSCSPKLLIVNKYSAFLIFFLFKTVLRSELRFQILDGLVLMFKWITVAGSLQSYISSRKAGRKFNKCNVDRKGSICFYYIA